MKPRFSSLLLLLLGVSLLCAVRVASGQGTVKPMPEGRRYLFLVDVSGGTKHCRDAIAQTVQNLVATGMNGEMREGDAFAIWPYREKVAAELFLPQTWASAVKGDLGALAGDFVRQQGFSNNATLFVAVAEAIKVVQASRVVTIFLISDGSELLHGTPFDAYANQIYREHAMEMWREKKPFVTTLLGAKGNIVACTVSVGGEVTLPTMPDAFKSLVSAPTVVKPVSAPMAEALINIAHGQPPPAKPLPAETATPAAMPLPPVAAVAPAAKPVPTSAPVAPTPVAIAPPAIVQPAPAKLVPPPAPMPTEVPLAVAPPSAVVAAVPPTLAPPVSDQDVTISRVPPAPEPIIAGAVPPVADAGGSRLLFLAITLVVVAVLIILIILRGRRDSRHETSLITRSMRR